MGTPAPIDVYVVNATGTSAGNGPGYATLPIDEALRLINDGLAVRGTLPPPNAEGSHGPAGQPNPVTPP
jgi:hypothetical protein